MRSDVQIRMGTSARMLMAVMAAILVFSLLPATASAHVSIVSTSPGHKKVIRYSPARAAITYSGPLNAGTLVEIVFPPVKAAE